MIIAIYILGIIICVLLYQLINCSADLDLANDQKKYLIESNKNYKSIIYKHENYITHLQDKLDRELNKKKKKAKK